ncbi:MAG: hypothetical protein ICV62_13125 [Cyanobacteria bacterium Co-bin13]|nr:hypothetical protein [Cyanobacteria bacterium Co-bin13]
MLSQKNESGDRLNCSIFVFEPDDIVRPLLKYNLQTWGYQLIVAIDEADIVQRLRAGYDRFDLILLNQCGQSIEWLLDLGRQVRQSLEFDGQTPILIIAEGYGADLEGQDVQVGENEYVTYLEDGQQLKVILQRLCLVFEADSAASAQQWP